VGMGCDVRGAAGADSAAAKDLEEAIVVFLLVIVHLGPAVLPWSTFGLGTVRRLHKGLPAV
jgi:hypothetical protein